MNATESYELYKKAALKVLKIAKSQCIEYSVFGGEIARENDIKKAVKVSSRLRNFWINKQLKTN